MDRPSIQRSDFPTVRRGYEPDAVDAHLRHVADEVEGLRGRGGPGRGRRLVAGAAHHRGRRDDRRPAARRGGRGGARARPPRLDRRPRAARAARRDARRARRDDGPPARGGRSPVGGAADAGARRRRDRPRRRRSASRSRSRSRKAEPERSRWRSPSRSRRRPARSRPPPAPDDEEAARLVALDMALAGTPREETERYLAEHYALADPVARARRRLRARRLVSAAPAELAALRERMAELTDLGRIHSMLFWDQNTMMPPHGAAARADHSATLELISHGKLTDPEIGRLLDALEPWADGEDPDSDAVRLVAAVRRDHEKAVRVPSALAAEISHADALGQQAWQEARAASDFASSATRWRATSSCATATSRASSPPSTPTTCCSTTSSPASPPPSCGRCSRRCATRSWTSCRRAPATPPTAATTASSPGPSRSTTSAARSWTCSRRSASTPTAGAWTRRRTRSRSRSARRTCASPRATTCTTSASRTSPRCTSSATASTRRASRPSSLAARSASPSRSASTSPRAGCGRTSSAARARSAAGCCRSCAGTSGPALGRVDADAFYRAVNSVQRSLIRVNADETTYNLHIILRFELELALIEGVARGRRPAGRLERGDGAAAGHRGPGRRPGRAAGRALGRRAVRLLPHVHARQPDRGAAVDPRCRPTSPRSTRSSAAASSRRCANGCASTSTATAASSRRASCCTA